MTSNSRPSYKEAQERLLKWCQNVTRNYEVSLKFFIDNQLFNILFNE